MTIDPSSARTAALMRILSNPVNLELLLLLSTRPAYTRELARLTGRNETEVSRRLRSLERAGLVRAEWMRIEGRSVRVYRLAVSEVKIRIRGGEVEVAPSDSRPLRVPVASFSPPRPGLLVGREREEALLRDPPTPVVVVWGISGIGKTSLAASALRGKPMVFWHTLTRIDSASYVLWKLGLFLASHGSPELLGYLGSPQADPGLAADVAIESLRGTGARLVFDDYHAVEDSIVGEVVAKIAWEAEGYHVYVLSRVRPRRLARLPPSMKTELRLEGLSPEDSMRLLEAHGSSLRGEAAEEAYRLTQGHPLLLTLIASAPGLGMEEARRTALDYIWGEVYSSLPDLERRILTVLSAFDEPVPLELVSRLTGLRDPAPLLYRLRDRGMVEAYEDGFRAHQLIRYLMGESGGRSLLAKAARYYESIGGWPARLKAIHYYLRAGDPVGAARIVASRVREDDYMYLQHLHAYAALVEELARHRLPPDLLVYVKHDQAVVEKLRSRLTRALGYVEEAIPLAEKLGDGYAEAPLRTERSYLLSELGRPGEAVEEARRAAAIAGSLGAPHLLLGALANLAKAQAELGEYMEALETVEEEARVALETGDPFYIVWSRLHLAEANQLAGRLGEAKRWLREASELAEKLGLIQPLFFACLGKAAILAEEGDWRGLLEWASKAERMLSRLGIAHRSARPKYYRALALANLGRREEALLEARWTLEIAGETEDRVVMEKARKLIEDLERG